MATHMNIRLPVALLDSAGKTLKMLLKLPRYQAMGLSKSALIRLALSLGLKQLQKEAKEAGKGGGS